MSRIPLSFGGKVTSEELESERQDMVENPFEVEEMKKRKWWRRAVNAFKLAFSSPPLPMSMDPRFQMRGAAKRQLNKAAKASKEKGFETTIFIDGKPYVVIPRDEYRSDKLSERLTLGKY
jgi:hypothetical protein